MTELDHDLKELLEAAREAVTVLRNDAERLEGLGLEAHPERDAIRRLCMAIQLVDYDLADPADRERGQPWDWRQL